MKIKAIAFIAALATPVVASADEPKTGTTTTTPDKTKAPTKAEKLAAGDIEVLAHQHRVDMMEIEMGKLAQRNGGAAVKSFGKTLVVDHSAADKETVAFAKKHGLAKIPMDMAKTEEEKAERKTAMERTAKLKKLKGAEFDRELADIVAMDHDKEIAKITAAIAMVENPDLATILRDKQPILQRHADQAHELQKANAAVSVTQPKTKQ